jgi:hypothetical protein
MEELESSAFVRTKLVSWMYTGVATSWDAGKSEAKCVCVCRFAYGCCKVIIAHFLLGS